jgi:hypothetical protein
MHPRTQPRGVHPPEIVCSEIFAYLYASQLRKLDMQAKKRIDHQGACRPRSRLLPAIPPNVGSWLSDQQSLCGIHLSHYGAISVIFLGIDHPKAAWLKI